MAEDADEEDENELTAEEVDGKNSSVASPTANSVKIPWEIENIDDCELLHIHRLNEWDYPIFDLASQCSDTILSKVSCRWGYIFWSVVVGAISGHGFHYIGIS